MPLYSTWFIDFDGEYRGLVKEDRAVLEGRGLSGVFDGLPSSVLYC